MGAAATAGSQESLPTIAERLQQGKVDAKQEHRAMYSKAKQPSSASPNSGRIGTVNPPKLDQSDVANWLAVLYSYRIVDTTI